MATQPVSIEQRITALAAELRALPGREARLAWLVARGRDGPTLAAEKRVEAALVPGCLAKLWLAVEVNEEGVRFSTASDSQIVQGVAVVLCRLAEGSGAELAETPPDALKPLLLERILSSNRRDAATRLWEAMQTSAKGLRV